MYEKRLRQIHVQCPGKPCKTVVTMEIEFIRLPDGWIHFPCTGCDFMNGTMPCAFCRSRIDDMIFRNPNMDLGQIIRPL